MQYADPAKNAPLRFFRQIFLTSSFFFLIKLLPTSFGG
jgi:hypothetical protein